MFKIGDTIVHRHEVCKVAEITENYRDGEDYYTLRPLSDETLIIRTPVSNSRGMMRKIISKAEAKALIASIPDIEIFELDTRTLASEYKKLLDSGTHEDVIRIIKTAYLRKEERTKNKLQASENDKIYFRLAEGILYSELSIALNLPHDEIKEQITKQIESAAVTTATPTAN